MTRPFVVAAGLALALAAPVSVLAADASPPIRAFDLPTIEKLGRAIYLQDRAAWLATDALTAKLPDLGAAGLKGWIVEGEGGDEKVRFLRDTGGGLEAGYDVTVTAKGAGPVIDPADRTLSAEERAAFAARQTAIKNLPGMCRQGYNSVVVKDVEGDGWLVWLLAPSPARDVLPFGGHYRFSVSADGQAVKRVDALSASCLTMDAHPKLPGARSPMLYVTHIVSPTPIETHVFLGLMYRVPIIVGTGKDTMWVVDNGKISRAK
ncbi:MAG TPA: hypothetical protein VNZ85_19405 [Caulobacter sp.]|nr:hypothetical protein [Caulobacter sp.]